MDSTENSYMMTIFPYLLGGWVVFNFVIWLLFHMIPLQNVLPGVLWSKVGDHAHPSIYLVLGGPVLFLPGLIAQGAKTLDQFLNQKGWRL